MMLEAVALEYWNLTTVFHRGGWQARQGVAPRLHVLAEKEPRLREVIVRDMRIEIAKMGVRAV
jgi:hypothetical protein